MTRPVATELRQGANAAVTGDPLTIAMAWTPAEGRVVEGDVSAFLLGASGRVRNDADMVFYNQPEAAEGAVRFLAAAGGRAFVVRPEMIPEAVARIVFCLTIHEAQARCQTLALLDGAAITVEGAGTALRYRPDLAEAAEAAMIFGELYRRADQWKFRAVGQGFAGGLAPLARSFGIDVADEAPAPPPSPPAPPPVRLAKLVLDRPGQIVDLEKRGADFGEIHVTLNWSRARRGLFSGHAIDLDLGCLFELADGRRGAVQALGRAFGAYDARPFIALSGDDRTGDVADGESLRINGAHWPEIRRIALFANIYDGVPNWAQTDGVVTIAMPGQPAIEVRMTDGCDDRRLCAIALLENAGGALRATRIVDYFQDQEALDHRFGWGIRWVAGSKD